MLRTTLAAAALIFLTSYASHADEEFCDSHIVEEGDTLFTLAAQYLGDQTQWSRIYYANPDMFASGQLDLTAGTELDLPCPEGVVFAEDTPLLQSNAEMKLVTASNYAPFTDRAWLGGGMVTELVNAALGEMPNPVTYSITWENDWSKHLFPILGEKQADMGFPWLKPDCAGNPENERCVNFHFSEPLVEMLVLLFVHKERPLAFSRDRDLHGTRICRPAGYFTHDLDRADRRWLSEGKIDLVRAESPDACFTLLQEGKVDAVSVNEFLGLTKIKELGLDGEIVPLPRPLSVEGLHMIIAKTHWRGTSFLYRFNAGLEALKASPKYDEIIAKHLSLFWKQLS